MTDADIIVRFEAIDRRLAEMTKRIWILEESAVSLSGRPAAEVSIQTEMAPATPPAPQTVTPPGLPAEPEPSRPEPQYASAPVPERRSSADWETLLGGNWLNKIGAFVLVVGIALALGYSFSHMGPAGRDAVGLAIGLAMLGSGIFYERRPRYQTFARGLIGGG